MASIDSSSSQTHTVVQEVEADQVEVEHVEPAEGKVIIGKVHHGFFYRLSQYWPFSLVVRGIRGVGWLLGFSPRCAHTPGRHSRPGRKRLSPFTRMLLSILPRRLQSALGYPVSSSIGCSLSPEIGVSPTKPYGKGNKRKQDDLEDEEEEEHEQHTWVEFLSKQPLPDEVGLDEDPNYEPSTQETLDTEEYDTKNTTGNSADSDIDANQVNDLLEDLKKAAEAKQDDLAEDEEEEPEQRSWAEFLSQKPLADEVGTEEDSNYEPSTQETESEEYNTKNTTGNTTDSDIDANLVNDLIEDLKTVVVRNHSQKYMGFGDDDEGF